MVLRRAPCLVSCSAVTLTFSIILSLNVRCVSEVQWPVGTPVSAIRPSTVPRQLLHAAPRSSRARVSSRFTSRRRSARLEVNRSECVTSLTEWGTDGSESCLLFKPELASNAEMQRCQFNETQKAKEPYHIPPHSCDVDVSANHRRRERRHAREGKDRTTRGPPARSPFVLGAQEVERVG